MSLQVSHPRCLARYSLLDFFLPHLDSYVIYSPEIELPCGAFRLLYPVEASHLYAISLHSGPILAPAGHIYLD